MIEVMVTGAGGFIGRAVVQALHAQGIATYAMRRADGDMLEASTWAKLPTARTVFHLAGRGYVPDSWKHPADYIETNVTGTQRALDYCRAHGAALVHASAYVYGIPGALPIREEDVPHPNNPYALSKLLAEQCAEFAARYSGINVTLLRLFNVYGPGQPDHFLIPQILKHIKAREPIQVLDLTPRRDYVYVSDIAEAFIKARKPGPEACRTINIGSGESYSVQQIIDVAQRVAGTSLPVISAQQTRPQEIPDVVADISRARRLLDWTPRHRLEDGIRNLQASMDAA